jgi:phospholipid transport system substrate-binding protein
MRAGAIYGGVTMLRPCALVLGIALVAASGTGARAATPTAELREFFAAATEILTDPATEGQHAERLHAIRARTRQIFDFHEAARLALGPAWRERTAVEREKFVELYTDLLERAFIAWIAAHVQIAEGPRVNFVGETVDEGYATVRTTVLGRAGDELSLDYRMVERGDRWAVRDVVINGMSLAANYRAQFSRVLQNASYAELVRQMARRTAAPPPAVVTTATRTPAVAPSVAPHPAANATPRLVSVWPSDPKPVDTGRARPANNGNTDARPGALSRGDEPSADAPRSGPVTFWVQLGAFKNPEAAVKLASALRASKPAGAGASAAAWTVVTTPGPDVSRVRIGPFPDRAEAELSRRHLATRGYRPFITEDRETPR